MFYSGCMPPPNQEGQQEGGANVMLKMFGPMIFFFVIMWVLLIRPQQKKQRAHDNLVKNLNLGGAGCISATTQICPSLARQVFNKKDKKDFEKLCTIRRAFDSTKNLVTSVHYFLSLSDSRYERMLPPLTPLSKEKQKNLLNQLGEIGFYPKRKAA